MILIPEERLLFVVKDILLDTMPGILLELEEALDSSIRLPPFRYVGSCKEMQPCTGMPYCLLEIRSSETEIKDRIIRNDVLSLTIMLGLSESGLFPLYSAAIIEALKSLALHNIHIRTIRKIYSATIEVAIVV